MEDLLELQPLGLPHPGLRDTTWFGRVARQEFPVGRKEEIVENSLTGFDPLQHHR